MVRPLPSAGQLAARVPADDRTPRERLTLAMLMLRLTAAGPLPSDLARIFHRFEPLRARLEESISGTCGGEQLEESFLELYAHLHLHEAPYSRHERARVTATGGYWCHAGGIDPVLRAGRYLEPSAVSVDLGAGNGLQGLLLQLASPHQRAVQIEISQQAIDIGRKLQSWLGIPSSRIEWVTADLSTVRFSRYDFVYLYRPLRPEGTGREFYRRLADALAAQPGDVTIFSVADCLREFLDPSFEVEFSTGHLTCYRRLCGLRRAGGGPAGRARTTNESGRPSGGRSELR